MARISTHVLDTAEGQPAKNVLVRLERQDASGNWKLLASAHTDEDGRCPQLLSENDPLPPATYRLHFDTAAYFIGRKISGFYPFVEIAFAVRQGEQHLHIPLLLSPHGYTTYRGS
jgi:5-hydroxyisourate hydrolase